MASRVSHLAASSALAVILTMAGSAEALAGGGDFVGGMIVGGVLGTILGANMQHHAPPPRRVVRRPVADPAAVGYWRSVQQALNEIGIGVGRPDGVPGRQTRAGVRAFQATLNSDPTGTLTQLEYQELMRQASVAMAMGGGPVTGPQQTYTSAQPEGVVPVAPAVPMGGQGGMLSVAQPMAPAYGAASIQPAVSAYAPAAAGQAMPVPAVQAPVQAPAAPAPTQIAVATPTDTKVVDTLLSPSKALSDKDVDDLEDNATILGVYIGDSQTTAAEAFAKSVGNCATSGALVECTSRSDAYSDKAAFATLKTDGGDVVYYLSRTISFTAPVPRDAIVAKLGETIKPIAAASDMTLSTAPICDRSMAMRRADRETAIGTYARDATTGAVGMAKLVGECEAFFTADIAMKDGLATGLSVMLFDGRSLPPLDGAPAASAAPDSTKLPAGIKF